MLNFCVGIVTYNPDINKLNDCIKSVLKFGVKIFVFDNGSINQDEINYFANNNVSIKKNKKNIGIAAALNVLSQCAMEDKFEWILTLDQDSECPPNLVKEYEKYTNDDSIGIICPLIRDLNTECNYNERISEDGVQKCITSGALVKLDVWNQINGYDESMFIDGVDFDFCRRVKAAGYNIIRTDNVILNHEIGHITLKHFAFFNVLVMNHNAFRKYYIARNIVYLERKSGNLFSKIIAVVRVWKHIFIVILYEADKLNKVKAMLRGMKDGITCKIDMRWI